MPPFNTAKLGKVEKQTFLDWVAEYRLYQRFNVGGDLIWKTIILVITLREGREKGAENGQLIDA